MRRLPRGLRSVLRLALFLLLLALPALPLALAHSAHVARSTAIHPLLSAPQRASHSRLASRLHPLVGQAPRQGRDAARRDPRLAGAAPVASGTAGTPAAGHLPAPSDQTLTALPSHENPTAGPSQDVSAATPSGQAPTPTRVRAGADIVALQHPASAPTAAATPCPALQVCRPASRATSGQARRRSTTTALVPVLRAVDVTIAKRLNAAMERRGLVSETEVAGLSVPHVAFYTPPAQSPDALPAPPVLARAAFLYDVTNRRVLYAWNARASLPMASTTKVMTALLAVQSGELDDWATTSYAAATIGQSSMYLQQGERLRIRDLLYGMLLPSGNDAAIAIAERIGGSQAAFVTMMNREAAALGLFDTHYANPYGLDAPWHYTSARDLAVLAMTAMQYPVFRQVVSTHFYAIPATAHNLAHSFYNINQPLWWYPGTVGVKPGTTDNAGRCAVEWVTHGNRTLALVVLGDVNLVTDVRNLLNWGFGDFSHWYSPLQAPVVYAPEYFGWDGPGLWVPMPGGGRYYARSGHTVRPPLLAPYLQAGGMVRYGAPTGEAFLSGGVWAQRFAGSWLFYNPRTRRLAPYASEVR